MFLSFKKKTYLCTMKNLHFLSTIILGCLLFCSIQMPLLAQEKSDSMKLSKSFMKELESAFSFKNESMKSAPINTLKPQELNSELLHEWVGPVKQGVGVTLPKIPGLSSEELLKESYLWKRGQYGMLKNGAITGLDVNALGKYLRPEEIRLRTMRQIADKARKAMDLYYPTTGLPAFGTKEPTMLAKETQLADTSSVKR